MFDDHNVFASLPSNWSVDYLYCSGAHIYRNCKIDCPPTQYADNSCSLEISREFCTCLHMITCPYQTKLCWLVKLPYSVSFYIYIYMYFHIVYQYIFIHVLTYYMKHVLYTYHRHIHIRQLLCTSKYMGS